MVGHRRRHHLFLQLEETVIEFESFEKIPRLKRGCVISEKIDGTNAQVLIVQDEMGPMASNIPFSSSIAYVGDLAIFAGSRSRFIKPDDDNFGFAAWVKAHAEELAGLGPGRHFGEWWGSGIQRRYGLTEKRFSLFNSGRWNEESPPPGCCHVAPVLYSGDFTTDAADGALQRLRESGSVAAPGFMKPEGIVVYHTASRSMYKVTIEKDAEPKGRAKQQENCHP
jgi:hypothetical protein